MMTAWHWIALSLALVFGIGVGTSVYRTGAAQPSGAFAAGSMAFASSLVVLLAQPIGHDRSDAP